MLPIELVSNTDPPRFTWQQVVDGRTIDHNGLFPPTVEGAVKKLIEMFKNLVTENAELRGKLMQQGNLLRTEAVKASAAAKAVGAVAEKHKG